MNIRLGPFALSWQILPHLLSTSACGNVEVWDYTSLSQQIPMYIDHSQLQHQSILHFAQLLMRFYFSFPILMDW